MAIGAAVMLLRLHFIHNDLGTLELFKDLGLDSDALEIRLANVEFAIMLQSQHASEINFAAGRDLHN